MYGVGENHTTVKPNQRTINGKDDLVAPSVLTAHRAEELMGGAAAPRPAPQAQAREAAADSPPTASLYLNLRLSAPV